MTELKTLKDLYFIFEDNHPHHRIDDDVKFTLRQKAIKLFKTKKVMMMTAQEFIHWWFNITEEDLK